MAGHSTDLFQLQRIRESSLTEQQNSVLNALALAMPPATPDSIEISASGITEICPPLDQGTEVYTYVWMVWQLIFDVAQSPEVPVEVQQRLVRIIQILERMEKGILIIRFTVETRLWTDLPLFADVAYVNEEDPIYMVEHGEEFTSMAAQTYHRFTAFSAQLMHADVYCDYVNATRTLRLALEEELDTINELSMSISECKMRTATTWIAHAASCFLSWAYKNIGKENASPYDETGQYVRPGDLYQGPATICLERWSFWILRLEILATEDSGLGEEARADALRAAQSMKLVESSTLNPDSPQAKEHTATSTA